MLHHTHTYRYFDFSEELTEEKQDKNTALEETQTCQQWIGPLSLLFPHSLWLRPHVSQIRQKACLGFAPINK